MKLIWIYLTINLLIKDQKDYLVITVHQAYSLGGSFYSKYFKWRNYCIAMLEFQQYTIGGLVYGWCLASVLD